MREEDWESKADEVIQATGGSGKIKLHKYNQVNKIQLTIRNKRLGFHL